MKMHYYKDENNQVWAYDEDQVSEGCVKDGLTEITEDETDELTAPPPPTGEQLVEQAELKKKRIMAEATTMIDPLQDAVDFDMATDGEIKSLKAWKKYRIMVNRIDATKAPDIEWPVEPE